MLYTLLKFLGWGMLLAFIGVCVGWALRSLTFRTEQARAIGSNVDAAELERLRMRLADLEPVVAERDRLRIQLADVRHADSPGIVGGEIPEAPESEQRPDAEPPAQPRSVVVGGPDVLPPGHGDMASSRDDAAALPGESAGGEFVDVEHSSDGADRVADLDGRDVSTLLGSVGGTTGPDDVAEVEEPRVLDLDAAARILGRKVTLDDLTVIEGIGPKICELCSGMGITTWRTLADTDVADLQSMLDAAGSRYAVHKPATWPRQAALLAAGRWEEFTTVTDDLEGGA